LAIQCILNIANHVVADLKLRLPADNADLFGLLADNKISPHWRKLTSMAGFRNILVHEYLEIDRRKVYAVLKRDLGDFEKFIRAVSRLL